MRSILIAFLIWQCFTHRIVSCTQTESTTPPAATTHSDLDSTIAHFDRKDSAIVTDRDSVAKSSRSEIVVGQRPAADTLIERPPKETALAEDSKKSADNVAMHNQNREPTQANEVDVSARSIDLPSLRSCVASRNCDSTFNERCVASDAGLVCGCGRGYRRNKKTGTCELAVGADPNAMEYEAAWQQHVRMLREGAEDRNDRGDNFDPWKLYGKMSTRDIPDDVNGIDSVHLRKERESWLLAELRRIRHETPQEVVSSEIAHSDEELRSDDQDTFQASERISTEPGVSAVPDTNTETSSHGGHPEVPPAAGAPTPMDESPRASNPEEAETSSKDSAAILDPDTKNSIEALPLGNPEVAEEPTVQTDESPRSSVSEDPQASTAISQRPLIPVESLAPAESPRSSIPEERGGAAEHIDRASIPAEASAEPISEPRRDSIPAEQTTEGSLGASVTQKSPVSGDESPLHSSFDDGSSRTSEPADPGSIPATLAPSDAHVAAGST